MDEFRKLYTGIKETEVREGLDALVEAKALVRPGIRDHGRCAASRCSPPDPSRGSRARTRSTSAATC